MQETASEFIINVIRAVTRPVLTFTGLISWVILYANDYTIPANFTWLVGGMVVWWFGDRTFFKTRKPKDNPKS